MKRISVPRTQTFRREKGFTLIEILIVIALIGIIMSVALPSLGVGLKVNIQSSTRELATTIRSAYDEAVLKGTVYRIAIDIDKGQYWVEKGERDYLMRTAEQEEEERRRNERRNDEEKEKYKVPFTLAQGVTKRKQNLPKGVVFTDIMTTRSKEAIKGGIAYAHVFPHGFIEKFVIHVKDSMDREATLIVNSVTGKSRLFQRYIKDDE